MKKIGLQLIVLSICFVFLNSAKAQESSKIIPAADRTSTYLPLLKGKRIGVFANHTSVVGNTHLVDFLLANNIQVTKAFGPEHGFRGTADAGEKVKGGKDPLTNITVVSLYGSHKKPTKEDLKGIDIVIYDIQDVGVRFYTYISTMTYVMEACAENGKELIVFDGPNPNGFYIDGPVMTDKYKSFLGLHNIPIVYGMTCGEYAQMVNGEGWMKNKVKCKLIVIPLKDYDRSKFVTGLPVNPSPNLPSDTAVLLYPSLGLFEGTIVSLGRGTDYPFQFIGNPFIDSVTCPFTFIPKSTSITKKPKYQDTICYGIDMRLMYRNILKSKQIDLTVLNLFYHHSQNKQEVFFDNNFNYHAGNEELKQQTKLSISPAEIRDSWKASLADFKKIRSKYLIYKDF